MNSDEKAIASLLSVSSDREGQVYVECDVREPAWCYWEIEVPNGITLAEALERGVEHHREAHAC